MQEAHFLDFRVHEYDAWERLRNVGDLRSDSDIPHDSHLHVTPHFLIPSPAPLKSLESYVYWFRYTPLSQRNISELIPADLTVRYGVSIREQNLMLIHTFAQCSRYCVARFKDHLHVPGFACYQAWQCKGQLPIMRFAWGGFLFESKPGHSLVLGHFSGTRVSRYINQRYHR